MYPSKKKKNCLCSRRPVPVPIPDSPLPPLRLPRSELAASRLPPASALGASPSALPACIRAPPRRALSHTRCFRARSLHRTQPPIPVRRPAVCRRAPRPALHQQPSCSHQLHREPSHRPTTKRSTQVDHPVLNS